MLYHCICKPNAKATTAATVCNYQLLGILIAVSNIYLTGRKDEVDI